jgi:hypothetical protein
MATTTTRLGLTKPANSENIDIAIINTNMDNIDGKINFSPVTSATRPAAPFSGQSIRETDTGRTYVHAGTVPASAGWIQIPNVAANFDLGSSVVINWGADTNIYRSAANTLKTDDALVVVGAVTASAALTVGTNLTVSGSAAITGNTTVGGTLNSTGVLSQGGKAVQLKNRILSGQVTITPIAASATPGTLVYGATLDGTVFRAWASPQVNTSTMTIDSCYVGSVTASACTVYLERSVVTNTVINILVVGSDT